MKFFKVQPRNSHSVSDKSNGNPHIKLSAKVGTLLEAHMPNKEQSLGSITIIISNILHDISGSRYPYSLYVEHINVQLPYYNIILLALTSEIWKVYNKINRLYWPSNTYADSNTRLRIGLFESRPLIT